MVLFFEFLLVAAVVVITWFALYAVYRLVTDEGERGRRGRARLG